MQYDFFCDIGDIVYFVIPSGIVRKLVVSYITIDTDREISYYASNANAKNFYQHPYYLKQKEFGKRWFFSEQEAKQMAKSLTPDITYY